VVAGFASEYRLATLVGSKPPGRLRATSAFKVGSGFRIALPVANYYTWAGNNLEGKGVAPDIDEPISPEALWSGEDNQLARALKALR
jgi:C-terminal processing protease CtpA/Prc